MNRLKPALLLLAAWLVSSAALPPLCRALKVEKLSRARAASGEAYPQEVAAGAALVRFKPGVSTVAAAAELLEAGFSVVRYYPRFDYSLVSLPEGMGVSAGLEKLASFASVDSSAPDRVFRPARVPDDPYVYTQYALSKLQAFGAWEYETGVSSRVTIAVIDTGINSAHPDLSGKMTGTSRYFTPASSSVPSDDQPPLQACNHATRVAGVAAASAGNGVGVAGLSWGAKLVSLRVFDPADCDSNCCSPAHDCYTNNCGTTEDAIGAAIDDIIPHHNTAEYGKIVVNISLGDTGSCSDSGLHPLQTAVTAAVNAGLMIFAAAGNEGYGYIDSPANCTGVYAVAATDSSDYIASFSNSDPTMVSKGLSAPGVGVLTTDLNGGYASASGTSFASPMAAGLAALVWSAKPSYTPAQVFDVMKNSADDLGPAGPDRDYGWGRINALKALRLASTGSKDSAVSRKASAYPNPFRPKTQALVTFTVPDSDLAGGAEVKVYTSEGELVKKLDSMAWDGRNSAGEPAASGVYIFRVKTDKDSRTGTFALIR